MTDRPDDLAREGVEHLQRAARELIQATRKLLDAAEELVEDPESLRAAVSGLGAVAQAAADRIRRTAGADEGDDDDPGGVERITVR